MDPPFYGNIDDFRYYNNNILTAAQISLIYENDATTINMDTKKCTIYKILTTPVHVNSGNWGITLGMGTTTYYYWIDPNAYNNTYINISNPVRFSYTFLNSSPDLSSVYIYFIADDINAGVYVNGSSISDVSINYKNITKTPTIVSILSGSNIFQFDCVNTGGPIP